MKKPISPCYKCEDRNERCHITCEKYQDYAGDVATIRAERHDYGQRQSNSHSKLSKTELKKRSRR